MSTNASEAWLWLLADVLDEGREVSPRGKETRELLQKTIELDMRRPVVKVPERKMNYQFMAAEAYWILSGDDAVHGIAPWNKHIAQFSDDGEKFFGAYGPKVVGQLDYVVAKLIEDRDSRQAVLNIWRESPPKTKDVPCTVSMAFNIRDSRDRDDTEERVMNLHAFMRSNDVWLGTVYDVFNFSMVAHMACAMFNELTGNSIAPGILYLTAASSHMYEPNWNDADRIIKQYLFSDDGANTDMELSPKELWTNREALMLRLRELRDSKPGSPLRWWER